MTIRAVRVFLLPLTASAAVAAGQTAPAQPPAIDFTGTLYANYQLRTDSASKAALGGKAFNKFDVERVYLTFRMPAGDKASVRVTTDIFQNTGNGYYNGWTVRLKYGYLQYNFSKTVLGRAGMLNTVLIDHEEAFWPRWISQTAVERAGFFASSDVGVASQITLPNRNGEIYATITNGTGYTSPEVDRFKDIAARLSWTPFSRDSGFMRTFAVSPWFYRGATASAAPTQFTDALARNRYGVFAGIRERRLTGGVEWAQRLEDVETLTGAAPTATQAVAERKGRLISAFAVVRPGEWTNPLKHSPFGVLARLDLLDPNPSGPAASDARNTLLIAGAFWDLTSRASVSLDYQGLTFSNYPTPPGPPAESKTIFAHMAVTF